MGVRRREEGEGGLGPEKFMGTLSASWSRHGQDDGGWWLVAVGGWWRLAVGGGWRLVAVGGWWRLAVGGPRGLSLRAVLKKNKLGHLRTALLCHQRHRGVLQHRGLRVTHHHAASHSLMLQPPSEGRAFVHFMSLNGMALPPLCSLGQPGATCYHCSLSENCILLHKQRLSDHSLSTHPPTHPDPTPPPQGGVGTLGQIAQTKLTHPPTGHRPTHPPPPSPWGRTTLQQRSGLGTCIVFEVLPQEGVGAHPTARRHSVQAAAVTRWASTRRLAPSHVRWNGGAGGGWEAPEGYGWRSVCFGVYGIGHLAEMPPLPQGVH